MLPDTGGHRTVFSASIDFERITTAAPRYTFRW